MGRTVKPPVRSNTFGHGARRLSAVAARPSARAAVGLSQLVRTVLLVLLLASALTAWASPAAAAWPVDFANTTLLDVNVAPDGHIGLREGGCNSVVGQAFAALVADGTPLWSVQPTGDLAYIDGCIGPFYDQNSNAYFSGDSDATPSFGTPRHLVSYDASGHLRWSQPLHYGFNTRAQQSVGEPFGNPGNIAEGADGSVYLIDGEDTGYGGGIQTHLRGFNEQTGAPGMDIDLTAVGGYPFGTLVQTTATGVLVGTVNGARFYSYSGQLEWTHDFWSLPGSQTGSIGVRERTPDGGLLVGASYDASSPEGNCMNGASLSNPTQPVVELHKVTASGLAWTLTTQPSASGTCADLRGSVIIRGTQDGGAVVSSDFAHPQVGRAVSSVAPAGTLRWTVPVDSAAVLADIRVGADGTVVLIEHTTRPCAATICGRLLLRFLSATTGTPNHADLMIDVPDPPSKASTADPSLPALLDAHTAPGRLVLGYQTSDDPTFGASPGPFERVDVLPVTGLGSDVSFNAGAASSPPPTYAALGDSYSSGEGNPPYEPGSTPPPEPEPENPSSLDTCDRSEAAYGPMLDHDMGLGRMTFGACSGAVTDDFFHTNPGNPTEPKQMTWLNPGIKTVTLTIGGDDGGFASVLNRCVAGPRSIWHSESFGCSKDKLLRAETTTRLSALAGKVKALTPDLRHIHPLSLDPPR